MQRSANLDCELSPIFLRNNSERARFLAGNNFRSRSPSSRALLIPENGLVASKLRKRTKNLLSFSHFVHKSLNLVISSCCLAEDGSEI